MVPEHKGMWLLSNRERDRIALVRLDIETGEEVLTYEDPQVDLEQVFVSYLTKEPLVAASYPDYQKLHFFDSGVEADSTFFREQEPVELSILSWDNKERYFTISVITEKGFEYYQS